MTPPPALCAAIARSPIISCDIFDTALRRRLARPEDVHLATGLRAAAAGLLTCSAAAFRDLRVSAEHAARRVAEQAGHDEVRLTEVYAHLHACGVVTDPDAMAALECAVERSVCVAVEPVRAALATRRADQRLVFVSDTLLPGRFLAGLLEANGYGPGCVVFSSADTRRNKASGRLFRHLIETLDCPARDILHIGDNPHSDVANARAAGLAVQPWPRIWHPPEPEAVAAHDPVLRLLHSHRRAEPAVPAADLHRYGTLLLVGFTLFVLAEARRRGIGQVYFLARDGHIPLAIARRLLLRRPDGPALRYLHVSRQAIAVPALAGDLPRLADLVGNSLLDRPLATALEGVGIDAATTTDLLRGLGIDPSLSLAAAGGPPTMHRLFEAGQTLIAASLAARRAAALAYLDQSGFLAPGPRLIVDVGWRGSTQLALAQLADLPASAIAGCYLGLWADALRPALNPATAAGYLFAFGHPSKASDMVADGYVLPELFLSAPHGSVTHYRVAAGVAEPVLASEPEPGATRRRAAVDAIEAGCLAEFDQLDAMLDGAWPEGIDPASALFDFAPLLTRPSAAQVATLDRIPFIQGLDGARTVPPVTRIPLHQMLLDPLTALRRAANAPWRAGTVRASLPWPFPAMTYGDFRHRLECVRRLLRR